MRTSGLKVLQRDRYGIFRGTALLAVLLVFAMGLNMYLHGNRDTLAAEERASDAARQIAAQFQQLIEDSVSQMNVASGFLSHGTEDAKALQGLSANKVFEAAALIENGEVVSACGTPNFEDDVKKSAEHVYGDVSAKIIAQNDDAIQIRIAVSENRELAAWISSERVHEVLGRAYDDEYGYAVFNVDTGIYLINHTHFTEHGYYDALLVRNHNKATEKLLNAPQEQAFLEKDNTASEEYYIAQMPTEIESWHIALLIPERLIDFNEGLPKSLYYIGLITIAICVAAVVVMSIYVGRKISIVNKAAQKENRLMNKLTELAAIRGQVAIFRYKRKEDVFDHYVDGVNLKKDEAGTYGIDRLAELCGFEPGEAERLRERCLEMKSGAESELSVHSVVNGSERFLRVSLKCSEDNENIILGCVQDCTQGILSQHRIEDERNFFSMMKPKSSSIWQINASKNRWKVCHCIGGEIMDRLGIHDRNLRDYEIDLNNAIRRYLHPEDFPAYAEEMSVNGIMNMFRKGKMETVHEYRTQNAKKNGFEWHRQVVRVFQNPETKDVMANIFIINVDAEKNAEMERRERSRMLQRSLTALGGLYRALFYVDLDNNICYTTKAPGGELISQHQSSFRETFDAFIDSTVAAEDRAKIKAFTGAYQLRKALTEANHNVHCEYMRISGDNLKRTAIIVQAARFENGTVRDIVIALRSLE